MTRIDVLQRLYGTSRELDLVISPLFSDFAMTFNRSVSDSPYFAEEAHGRRESRVKAVFGQLLNNSTLATNRAEHQYKK